MTLFIIAPMGAGKTTFLLSHPSVAVETDAAQPPLGHPLHAMRLTALRTGVWSEYNKHWIHDHLIPWFRSLKPAPRVVLIHSLHDVRALDSQALDQNRVSIVLPDRRTMFSRAMARLKTSRELAALTAKNYMDVEALSKRHPTIPVFPSIGAATAAILPN